MQPGEAGPHFQQGLMPVLFHDSLPIVDARSIRKFDSFVKSIILS
ncbi:Uncharacterized protein ChrSV_1512 [Chromobacterium vaccinii]|nr:Uncharacterized protein ChrSW_1512 [Chromobacterium vaccinii]QND88970.1 Uncharacterized protein ChrSV_1512 [Chromobacterium vaccinii]